MTSIGHSQQQAALANFDSIAAHYDHLEAANPIMQWMRQRVHRAALATFHPHARILEIGCGTGTDALFFARRGHHLVATEPSAEMLATAREKISRGGCALHVDFIQIGAEQLHSLLESYGKNSFDALLSNFGALNCVADLRRFSEASAQLLRPGGKMLLNIMPPVCPWEIAYFLLRLNAQEAFRRWRGRTAKGGIAVRLGECYVQTYYHSCASLKEIFSERFEALSQFGLGVLVPPPYLAQHQRIFKSLCWWDEKTSDWPLLRNAGDHVVMIFRRK